MDVSWLDEQEAQAWQAVAALTIRLPGRLDAQMQCDSGITLFEYFVLSYLSMAPERQLRMSDLARMTNGSLSRLSNVVKRLESRGWMHRSPDPEDGRYTVATLTDSGMTLVERAAPGHVQAVRRFVIDPLTATQIKALTAAGRRIVAGLEEPSGQE